MSIARVTPSVLTRGRVSAYLQQRRSMYRRHIDEFIKGMNDGAQNADDKKPCRYNAGIGVGNTSSGRSTARSS